MDLGTEGNNSGVLMHRYGQMFKDVIYKYNLKSNALRGKHHPENQDHNSSILLGYPTLSHFGGVHVLALSLLVPESPSLFSLYLALFSYPSSSL